MAADRERPQRRQPVPLGSVLLEYLQTSGLSKHMGSLGMLSAWAEVVGEDVREHTRVVGLKSGVLRVEVDSAPWLQELSTFYKPHILKDLQEKVKDTHIRDITFRIGHFERKHGK